jgi:hypothetical protein
VVQQAWNAASHAILVGNVLAHLNHLHGTLHDWDKAVLKALKKRLRRAQPNFEKAVCGVLLLEQEDICWLQRSRANWLQHGDQNTNFFHNSATTRRKKNYIKKFKDDYNPYGLMVALGYVCRTCPWTMLEPYVGFKVVRR